LIFLAFAGCVQNKAGFALTAIFSQVVDQASHMIDACAVNQASALSGLLKQPSIKQFFQMERQGCWRYVQAFAKRSGDQA
jgi:hypothetical protein